MLKKILFIVLIFGFIKISYSQSNIRLEGIGGKIGYIIPESPIYNTFSFSAHADLGNIFNRIYVGAIAEFWSKSYNSSALPNNYLDGKWTEFILAPTFKLKYYTGTKAITYIGGGVGFAIVNFINDMTNLSQSFKLNSTRLNAALFLFGGAEYPITPRLKGIGEIKFHLGGANFLGMYLGATYLLPTK